MNKDEALKMAIDVMENSIVHCEDLHHAKKDQHKDSEPCPVEQRWHTTIQACKEALKPHPNCDESCMYQCEMEKKHGMTYEQGFAHGYEAYRAEQALRIKNDSQS